MESAFGIMIWALTLLMGILIGSLFWAIILRVAAKWVQKMEVPFGNAYMTALLAIIATFIAIAALTMRTGTQSQEATNTASLIGPVSFFISMSAFVSARIKIPFGRACLVSLAMIGIGLAIILIVAVPVILISKFAM
jgi:hypothetical protein